MANVESKIAGGSTGGYYIGVEWTVNSQSSNPPKSNVTASVYVRSSGSGYTISSTASKDISLTINGTKYTGTNTIGIGTNSKKVLLTKTVDVPHNSDGTKTCSFAGTFYVGFTLSGTALKTVSTSGSATFPKITVNTPPSLGGSVSLNVSGTIPENTGNITVSWPAASDAQNNVRGYRVYRYVNGSHNNTYWPGDTSMTDNLSGFGSGTSIYYKVWAYDAYDAYSGEISSSSITKNTLTGGYFTSHSNDVSFNTTQFTLYFDGGRNSNGSGVTYNCYSDDITIYNRADTSSKEQTIYIWKSGATPNGPYIKFDELKDKFKNSNFNGRLHVGLRTGNSYGSYAWAGGSIGVDLRTNMTVASGSTTINSNSYYSIAGKNYIIPNRKNITLNWPAATDPLGTSITYRIEQNINSGGWSTLRSGVSGTSYSFSLNTSGKPTYAFRVVAQNGYSREVSINGSPSEVMYSYSAPGVTVKSVGRTSDKLTVEIATSISTDIPGNAIKSLRWVFGSKNGTLATSATKFEITGLSEETSGNFTITIEDNHGASVGQSAVTISADVPQFHPVFSIRKNGVGINGIADGSASLVVKGKVKVDGGIVYHTLNKPSASDIGARPSNWMPTAAEVGARPSNWTPTWNDVSSKPTVFDLWNDNWQRRSGQYSYLYHMSSKENGTLVIAPSTVKEGTTADWDKEYNFYQNGVFNAKYIQARQDLRVGVNTSTGGTIYPFNWSGSWLSGKSQGGIVFGKQSTGSYHSNLLFHASSDDKVSIGGLGTHIGFNMYRSEETNNTVNQYFRLNCQDELMECSMPIMYRSARLWTGSLGSGGGSLTLSNGMKYASINIGARPGGSGDVFTSIATGLLTTTVAYYQITNEAQYLKFAIRADGNNIIMSWNAGTSGSVIKSVYGV